MKKALVIGINDYPNAELFGCVNDASAVANILETHGNGSPNFSVKLETNVSTRPQLKSLIDDLFSGNVDTALLYFSGHGYLNSLGGYLVTPDFEKYDEGVSMDDILKMANGSKAKDKIIILDCCHSGIFGTPTISGGSFTQIIEGVVILTASGPAESAVEVNGHGIFTNLLIDALQGGAADLRGHITPGSIYAYIDQALGAWDQRPVFKTNVTRFTSLREITPAVPLEILRKLIVYFPTPQHEFLLDPSFEDTNKNFAKSENVSIFKDLQKFQSVGLVVPVGEEFMYFAAQNSKSCRLTAIGFHYWKLAKEKRL